MSKSQNLSFTLPDEVVGELVDSLPDPWQGNTFGHTVFLSKYSRKKPDGTKETWAEVVRRCVEGCYSIQRDWTTSQLIPWSDAKALNSAVEMFRLIYTFRFTPPGRGLWMMGTDFVHDRLGSAALQNCAFVSTDEDIVGAATFLMEASMLGVGVGFDTAGEGEFIIQPTHLFSGEDYVIPDNREGWVRSVEMMLNHFFGDGDLPSFDYSAIRQKGEPISGFGGTAAGPEPLKKLHRHIYEMFRSRDGEAITQRDIVDLMNVIGVCVVAGNVRRSAEIALVPPEENGMNLKNYSLDDDENEIAHHPAAKGRSAWGWASNNSVVIRGNDNVPYQQIADLVANNGEPGVFWLRLSQDYGRLGDPPNRKDWRAQGTNPCGEQTLESYEMCNLVETYPSNHDTIGEYLRTLKFAYLYAKSVTLMNTHWQKTNAIMLRNRRIGTSMSGVFQFVEEHGLSELTRWARRGYDVIQRWDRIYSEWLCVRESIKTTSVKPSGTVSKMVRSRFKGQWYSGITSGAHAPVARQWIQHMTLDERDPVLKALVYSGHRAEPGNTPGSFIVSIPVKAPPVRTQSEVTMWEKAAIAAALQREWADNSVSVTISFSPEEASQLANLLHTFNGQLKAVSFMPNLDVDEMRKKYRFLPQDPQSQMKITEYGRLLNEPDFSEAYEGGESVIAMDAEGELFCDGDRCIIV